MGDVEFFYKPKGKIILVGQSCVHCPVLKLVTPDYSSKLKKYSMLLNAKAAASPTHRTPEPTRSVCTFFLFIFIYQHEIQENTIKYLVSHLVTQIELLFDCLGSIPMVSRFFVLKNIFSFTTCTPHTCNRSVKLFG